MFQDLLQCFEFSMPRATEQSQIQLMHSQRLKPKWFVWEWDRTGVPLAGQWNPAFACTSCSCLFHKLEKIEINWILQHLKKKGWHIESGFVSDSSPANVWVPKNSGATWHLAVGLSGLGHLCKGCKGVCANTSKVKDVKCIWIWISIWSKCLCLNVAFCRCTGSALPSWFAVIQVALICILRCILPCIASCHRNSLKILSAHLVVA